MNKIIKPRLRKNSLTFEEWCIQNNRQDILDRWDYELNNITPNKIACGTHAKYWFKCPRKIHQSELKNIKNFTSGSNGVMNCRQCNSFAQWGIDNIDPNFLEKYWDYEKNNVLNINPWEISYCSSSKKAWIKCQEVEYHGSYLSRYSDFSHSNARCPYCSHTKIHPKESLGQYIVDNYGQEILNKIWSEKNKKSPYKYGFKSDLAVWWKCPDNQHNDFKRVIGVSNVCDFRCPECQFSKGEKRIENWLVNHSFTKPTNIDTNNIKNNYYIPQKEFDGLIGIGGGNLSYDFYLPQYNLLIEYQGQFHDGNGNNYMKKNLKRQQEHDKRKKRYAEQNNITLLEIWYWDYENVEQILNNTLKIDKLGDDV